MLLGFLGSAALGLPNNARAQSPGAGCGGTTNTTFVEQCQPWQKPVTYVYNGLTVTICVPTPDCIMQPAEHWYFDDPILRTRQKNDQEVTLPAGLAWSDAPGLHYNRMSVPWERGAVGSRPQTSKIFGINSYIVEIDNTKGQLNEGSSKGGIFRFLTKNPYFNPTDGDLNIPCFFNSDTDIRWRVRPCVGEDGSDCESESRAEWWTFRTSPAPEPLTPKDPDWNGPQAASNVNFCQAALSWCSAVVSAPKKPYNQDQGHALSYQISTHSDEAKVINLNGSAIPARFAKYADWLKIDKLGYGPKETCHYLEKQSDGACKPEVVNPTSGKEGRLYFSNYLNPNNDRGLFTKNITYFWQPRSCFNNSNAGDDSCQKTNFIHYGQKWKFTTATAPIDAPTPSSPPDDPLSVNSENATPIGLPATIAWKQPCGANSYGFQIQEVSGAAYKDLFIGERRTVSAQVMFSSAESQSTTMDVEPMDLKLDTAYRWRARSCWPSLPLKTGDCDAWSGWFNFRTTGRAPIADSMQPPDNSNQVALPVILQWENVPGALSYIVEVNGNNQIVHPKSETGLVSFQLAYPAVTQNKTYHWKVRTCADINATNCGQAGEELTFNSAALQAPTASNGLRPRIAEKIQAQDLGPSYAFSWDAVPGAMFYRFKLAYADKAAQETNKECATGEKTNVITDSQNSFSVPNSAQGLYCLGNYKWSVQACMDQACDDAGPVSPDWTFTLAGDGAPKNGSYGLGVCSQPFDNPGTPYDEREACQPKHFLLVIEKIINFLLFNLAFWLLPFLGVATGLIFYKSLGGPEVWQTIKSWWRAIGIGYALLFLAWTITGMLLRAFGITAPWWKL